MLVAGQNRALTGFEAKACSLVATAFGFSTLALTGDIIPAGRYGFAYCDDLDCFFVRMADGDRQTIWKLQPPASNYLARSWTVTKITMAGVTVAAVGHVQGMWKRFMYVPRLKCLMWVDDIKGAVYAYRPVGT